MQDFKLTRGNVLLLSVLILVFVYLAFAGYAMVYRLTGLPGLIGMSEGGALDLFEKTFGLAASLVIALVAVVLAIASLEISRSQTALAERQARLELESQLTQIALGSPEIAKEAVTRADEAVNEAAKIMKAVTSMNAKIIEGRMQNHAAWHEHCIEDPETGEKTETEWYQKEQEAIIGDVKAFCEAETRDVLSASRSLVGFIARHADDAEREDALARHFGDLFDVLPAFLEKRASYLAGLDDFQAEWIERVLAQEDLRRRKIAVLGYLTSVDLGMYRLFDSDMLLGWIHGEMPAVCADLRLDIATGRYIDLITALEEMSRHTPRFAAAYNGNDSIKVDFIAALVSAALDLANPYRLIGKVKQQLDSLQSATSGPDPRIKEATLESLIRYIHDHMPYAAVIFDRTGADMSTGFVTVADNHFHSMDYDEDGFGFPVNKDMTVRVYPQKEPAVESAPKRVAPLLAS